MVKLLLFFRTKPPGYKNSVISISIPNVKLFFELNNY